MSWEQLLSIRREAAQMKQDDERATPTACPNDGEPLQQGREAGQLVCPFDGWKWNGVRFDE